MLISFMDFSEW